MRENPRTISSRLWSLSKALRSMTMTRISYLSLGVCAGLDSAQGGYQKSWLYSVSAQAEFAG
jgi:hypothetical protein